MLKSGDNELIRKTFNKLNAEAKNIVSNIVELCWYMRGGIQYHDMLMMTYFERQTVQDFISKRMKQIEKHSFPVY